MNIVEYMWLPICFKIQRLFYLYSTGFSFIFNDCSFYIQRGFIYIQRGFIYIQRLFYLYSTSLRFYSTTFNQLKVYFAEQTISGLQNIKNNINKIIPA